MSNGASVSAIFIPPDGTRVCCSVLEGVRAAVLLLFVSSREQTAFFAHENRSPCGRGMGAGSHAALSAGEFWAIQNSQKCSEKIPHEPLLAFPL